MMLVAEKIKVIKALRKLFLSWHCLMLKKTVEEAPTVIAESVQKLMLKK